MYYIPTFLQILVQHIKNVLPGLKSRINAQLVAVAKEHAAYGDVAESKVCIYVYMYITYKYINIWYL